MAFFNEIKGGFAGLEEKFNLSAFYVDADNVFFEKIRISTHRGKPILTICLVSDTYNF